MWISVFSTLIFLENKHTSDHSVDQRICSKFITSKAEITLSHRDLLMQDHLSSSPAGIEITLGKKSINKNDMNYQTSVVSLFIKKQTSFRIQHNISDIPYSTKYVTIMYRDCFYKKTLQKATANHYDALRRFR